ncbi:MAG: restriction endonuclease subunit S [Sedimentisphaerales bacterium]
MMDYIDFKELVDINPSVKLSKGNIYNFIDMAAINPGNKKPLTVIEKEYNGGGAKFSQNDTIFARITPCLENGKIAKYDGEDSAFGSTEFWVFRAKKGISDPDFVYYLASSDIIRKPAEKSMSGASGRQRADVESIKCLLMPKFPLPVQKQIASILSAYDDLIENNSRRIKILEEMAQRIYKQWFVDFKFPGHEKVKFTNSPLGKIPEGWEVSTLGKECNIVMGQSPKSEFYNEETKGLPFHQGVTDFGANFPNETKWCTVENRIAENGDILFSVRAPVGRINIANKRMVIGRGLSAINHKAKQQAFIYYQLKEKFQEEDTIGGGTIFKSVTKNDMHRIEILVPDKKAVSEYNETATSILDDIKALTKQNANLRRTRDLLLPKLINGEIEVAEIEKISEQLVTASVLPQKIQTPAKSHKASEQFKEAVLIAALVRELSSAKFLLSRMRYQKNCYLVLRKAEYDVTHKFLKKAAGPYDHKIRYKGGEGIALRKGYIKSTDATHFVVGENIAEIDQYLVKYDFADGVNWAIQHFKYRKNEQLELLTTVDYAAVELHGRNEAVTADSVYSLIESEPKWLPKLHRIIFSKVNIQIAINELKQYFPETYNN